MVTDKTILAVTNTFSGKTNSLTPEISIPFTKSIRRTG